MRRHHVRALHAIIDSLEAHMAGLRIVAVGYWVVHGGTRFVRLRRSPPKTRSRVPTDEEDMIARHTLQTAVAAPPWRTRQSGDSMADCW
jgi:acetate kinase